MGVDDFNLKLNTALADQNSFRKATKAFVEYQNKGLGELGLKPEDLGATHYNPANLMAKQSNKWRTSSADLPALSSETHRQST